MKVLISDYPEILAKDGAIQADDLAHRCPEWDIQLYPYQGNNKELKKRLQDTDALITGFLPMKEELIACMKPGSCISVTARGYDNIDIKAAARHSIAVMAIEEYCTEEVAEHTFALILGLARCLKNPEREDPTDFHILKGKSIGIFGYGKIGRRTAQIADALGMHVAVYDTHGLERSSQWGFTDANTIFRDCDVISNHMSSNRDNYHFFNDSAFEIMKKRPLFINCARGETVDTTALIRALDNGMVAGAGLDVLEEELTDPKMKDDLSANPNVILTPHIAFASKEALRKLYQISVDNAVFYLNKEYERVTSFVPGAYQC